MCAKVLLCCLVIGYIIIDVQARPGPGSMGMLTQYDRRGAYPYRGSFSSFRSTRPAIRRADVRFNQYRRRSMFPAVGLSSRSSRISPVLPQGSRIRHRSARTGLPDYVLRSVRSFRRIPRMYQRSRRLLRNQFLSSRAQTMYSGRFVPQRLASMYQSATIFNPTRFRSTRTAGSQYSRILQQIQQERGTLARLGYRYRDQRIRYRLPDQHVITILRSSDDDQDLNNMRVHFQYTPIATVASSPEVFPVSNNRMPNRITSSSQLQLNINQLEQVFRDVATAVTQPQNAHARPVNRVTQSMVQPPINPSTHTTISQAALEPNQQPVLSGISQSIPAYVNNSKHHYVYRIGAITNDVDTINYPDPDALAELDLYPEADIAASQIVPAQTVPHVSYLGEPFLNIDNEPVETVPDINTGSVKIIHNIVAGQVQKIPSIVRVPAETVPSIVAGPIEAIHSIVTGPAETVPSIVAGPIEAAPSIVTGLIEIVPGIVTGLTETVPSIVTGLIGPVPGIVTGPTETVPSIITGPMDTVPNIVTGPIETVPNIVTGPIETVPNIVTGLIETVPNIVTGRIETVPSIFSGLVETVPNNVPSIIVAIETVPSIVPGHADIIPSTGHVETVPGIVSGPMETIPMIVTGPIETVPNIATAPVETVPSLVTGPVETVPSIVIDTVETMPSIDTGLTKTIPSIVTELIEPVPSIVIGTKETVVGTIVPSGPMPYPGMVVHVMEVPTTLDTVPHSAFVALQQ